MVLICLQSWIVLSFVTTAMPSASAVARVPHPCGFCKGGVFVFMLEPLKSVVSRLTDWKSRKESHPCKNRKDAAPTYCYVIGILARGWVFAIGQCVQIET